MTSFGICGDASTIPSALRMALSLSGVPSRCRYKYAAIRRVAATMSDGAVVVYANRPTTLIAFSGETR